MVTPVPQPGPHGGDGPAVARALGLDPNEVLDLSVSLNPFAPDVTALAARHLESLHHYPDPSTAARLLAEAIGADADRLVLTNGGAEAIWLARARFGGTVASEPEFALHPRTGAGPTWRSDPHNPSGRLAADDEHADIWDEAFYPLATGRWTAGRPSLATVGSLTKLFACPGLRLGYVIADDITAPLWSVNSLALAMLPDLLEAAELDKWARAVADRRAELAEVLVANGFVPEPSDANWLLVEAPGLRDRLAHHGVVIRDCTSFGLPHHVRVAVPDERGLERLSIALAR
jgi:histidinol-phosphate/aromatic aminotransferase/cobyric acid decarboxylase-like protein